ncbi:olfactory receptor 11G2-like [Erythrolamprus reginae]|uniref:olfactory receptor 11G2-like n=1 Tax=Erythrolamprus reginae TaxID=121349 RepID=UPI00396C81EA
MELANGTAVQEFILLGFGIDQQKRFLLLVFLIILYVLTLVENSTIIILVCRDNHLGQVPMYILLRNFSWLEMCYVTTTIPRMLFDLLTHNQIISFHVCFLQFYVLFSLGLTEFFFLSAMALDRYLAICHPLHYPIIMSPHSCYILVTTCWILGFLGFITPVVLISKLSFCGTNIIDHFLCDLVLLLSVACPPFGNTPLICQIIVHILFLSNVLFVMLSYGIVIYTLLKSSNKGNSRKGFNTISMHLLVVTIFYSTVGVMYVIPVGENYLKINKTITLFYTAIIPFLNPLIYCLRNDQVKEALHKLLAEISGSIIPTIIV